MRFLIAVLILAAAPLEAQLQIRPTDAPSIFAANEPWYQRREPLRFAGDLYYPAGAAPFFNGNTMVRVGHFGGVPLYADTTVEPYSVVLVPIGRGLMQPYERVRRDALAGTTGSRAPSFPVQLLALTPAVPMTAIPPTALPTTPGAIVTSTGGDLGTSPTESTAAAATERGRARLHASRRPGSPAGPSITAPTGAPTQGLLSVRAPGGNYGVWINFDGRSWLSHGAPVPLTKEYSQVGRLLSTPVYTRTASREDIVYLPTTRPGVLAPYRLRP